MNPVEQPSGTQRIRNSPQVAFLIFASPKSGTTWLQRMISSHPQVHCSESRPFGDYFNPQNPSGPHISLDKYVGFLKWYYHGPVPADQPGDFYRVFTYNILDTMAATTLAWSGKSIYGEKATPPSPDTCRGILDGFFDYNPNLRFIHLTRDPRDVAVSGLVHQYRLKMATMTAPDQHDMELVLRRRRMPQADLEQWISLWIEAVEEGSRAARRFEQSITLRYEDLVAEPYLLARKLLNFLHADSSENVVRECVDTARFERLSGGRSPGHEDQTSFFRKGVVGDWANWLTAAQTQWVKQHAGPTLERLGYSD